MLNLSCMKYSSVNNFLYEITYILVVNYGKQSNSKKSAQNRNYH